MCLSGVSMLRGAAISLIALNPSLLCGFSVVIICRFFSFICFFVCFVFSVFPSFLSQPNTPFSLLISFATIERTEVDDSEPNLTVENYSLDLIVFGSIYRQEVPLEAALQSADPLRRLFKSASTIIRRVLFQ